MTENIQEIINNLFAERAMVFAKEKELTSKIQEAKLKHCENTTGIKIGGLVKDKKGSIYKVADVGFWDTDLEAQTIWATPQKKGGAFGAGIRNLWVSSDEIVALKEGEIK